LDTRKSVIRQLGGSLGVVIPAKMLSRYNLATGDRVTLKETAEGIVVTPIPSESPDES
jgi:antitoxin component of MazEF toxin-antitoxin module